MPRLGVWCGLGVPLRRGGSIIGVLEFFSSRAQDREPVMRFFETVSNQISGLIERSDLREKETEQEAILRASANLSSLGEMAAGISHEINNPLAAILLSAAQAREHVASGSLEPGLLDKMLERVERSAERIQKIVHGMRTLSRDGSGDPYVKHSVMDLVEDTMAICQARFRNADVRLDVVYGCAANSQPPEKMEGEPCQVLCRPVQLGQVLMNLLNNAFDAVVGSPDAWIKIACRRDGDFTCIEVADSGKGIAPEVAAKIMKPFFTTKKKASTTSLKTR